MEYSVKATGEDDCVTAAGQGANYYVPHRCTVVHTHTFDDIIFN